MSLPLGPRVKFTLRMPASLEVRLSAIARRRGVPLNTWITRQLEKEAK